jgi:hypothetical protein
VRSALNVVGGREPALAQLATQERERVAAQREAEPAVIGDDVLALGRRG